MWAGNRCTLNCRDWWSIISFSCWNILCGLPSLVYPLAKMRQAPSNTANGSFSLAICSSKGVSTGFLATGISKVRSAQCDCGTRLLVDIHILGAVRFPWRETPVDLLPLISHFFFRLLFLSVLSYSKGEYWANTCQTWAVLVVVPRLWQPCRIPN